MLEKMCAALCIVCTILVASVSLFGSGVEASTFITPVLTHPDHPGKCWHKETQTAIKPGHIINIPYQCIQLICTKDLRISGAGCSPQETLDENCHKVGGNLRLDYPACCPTFECEDPEDENANEHENEDENTIETS